MGNWESFELGFGILGFGLGRGKMTEVGKMGRWEKARLRDGGTGRGQLPDTGCRMPDTRCQVPDIGAGLAKSVVGERETGRWGAPERGRLGKREMGRLEQPVFWFGDHSAPRIESKIKCFIPGR